MKRLIGPSAARAKICHDRITIVLTLVRDLYGALHI